MVKLDKPECEASVGDALGPHAHPQQEGHRPQLTAVVVERGEVGLLLRTAGAVAHPHLQLIPRGFLQVIQYVGLGEGGALSRGPCRSPEGPVLEREGGDGAATIIPADEVQPHARGVDAGKELLLLGELGLYGEWTSSMCKNRSRVQELSPPSPHWAHRPLTASSLEMEA